MAMRFEEVFKSSIITGFELLSQRYFVQDCLNLTIVGNSVIAVFFRSDMYLGAFHDLLLRVL